MTASLVGSSTFGFNDANAGHVVDLGSAPSVGQRDVLCVNSNTVVSTPAGFTANVSQVGGQGAYIFSRLAVGGEGQTVTVTTSGNHDTQVSWSRWAATVALDVASATAVDATPGTATPAHSTGALAMTNELVIAFGALHSLPNPLNNSPAWSAGYTPLTSITQGTGASGGVTGYLAYRTDAGTAAETPQVNWVNAVGDRYMLTVAFTTAAAAATGSGTFDIGAPAMTVSIAAETEDVDADFSLTAPAMTVSITATSPEPPIPPISPTRMNFGPVLAALQACVCDALTTAGVPVCACMITIGQATADRCDCGCPDGSGSGQVAIWVASTYLSASFPTPAPPDRIDMGCGPAYLVANIVVEILRCAPTVSDQAGNAPSVAALVTATLAQQTDASLVRQAVGCCLVSAKADRDIARFTMGQQLTVEPQGNCAGSQLAIQVALQACICAG